MDQVNRCLQGRMTAMWKTEFAILLYFNFKISSQISHLCVQHDEAWVKPHVTGAFLLLYFLLVPSLLSFNIKNTIFLWPNHLIHVLKIVNQSGVCCCFFGKIMFPGPQFGMTSKYLRQNSCCDLVSGMEANKEQKSTVTLTLVLQSTLHHFQFPSHIFFCQETSW